LSGDEDPRLGSGQAEPRQIIVYIATSADGYIARADGRVDGLGEGIPLIAPRHRTVPLMLPSTTKFSDGVVRLHDAVGRSSSIRTDRRPALR